MYMKFWRGVDGTLYIDKMGSILESTNFERGEVKIDNALKIRCMWRRPGGAALA